MLSMGDIPTIERIAGRPYLNYSLMYSFLIKIMRKHERVMNMTKDSIGVPPAGVEVPSVPRLLADRAVSGPAPGSQE